MLFSFPSLAVMHSVDQRIARHNNVSRKTFLRVWVTFSKSVMHSYPIPMTQRAPPWVLQTVLLVTPTFSSLAPPPHNTRGCPTYSHAPSCTFSRKIATTGSQIHRHRAATTRRECVPAAGGGGDATAGHDRLPGARTRRRRGFESTTRVHAMQ